MNIPCETKDRRVINIQGPKAYRGHDWEIEWDESKERTSISVQIESMSRSEISAFVDALNKVLKAYDDKNRKTG